MMELCKHWYPMPFKNLIVLCVCVSYSFHCSSEGGTLTIMNHHQRLYKCKSRQKSWGVSNQWPM